MNHLTLKIYGHVQGVFFRETTKDKAKELGLVGWVRNESDGTVSVVAEGGEEQLKKLLQWCRIGPQYARVEMVEEEWEEAQRVGFKEFKVVY